VMKTMRALVKKHRRPGLWLEDVPLPRVGTGEVLIRVLRTAICGTDVHIFAWDDWAQRTVAVPLIAGHEFVGRISELGDGVQGLEVGQLVTGEGHIVCGRCRSCRAGRRHLCVNTVSIGVTAPGAFAEFLALPAVNVWPVAESIPLDTLAVFDPLGNAVHTALSFDLVGEDVLVTGAGPVGCLAAAVARHVGARHVVITDINPSRLALAEKMGVSLALDANAMSLADAMTSLGMQEGFDVGLEMSGSAQALEGMIAVMRHGGRIGLLGFIEGTTSMSWEPVIFGGLTI
jgi:threonine 3-dehydrogenase